MALKPIPRLILIAAVIGGAAFGINKYFGNGALRGETTASIIPTGLDMPVASGGNGPQAAGGSIDTVSMPQGKGNYTAKVLVIPWNATAALHYANGDALTKPGSLMAKRGVNLLLERQDDYAQMVAEQALFAAEAAAGVDQPAKGAAFVIIMGDALPGYASSAKAALEKMGQQIEVVGAVGYSRGEDKFMGPPEWKADPT